MHRVAVQPVVRIEDYASGHAFERKLDTLAAQIAAERERAGRDDTAA